MLSDDLDALSHPERIPALLRLLREQADPAATLAELAAGGPTARYLAVVAAAASGHRPIVVQALTDQDPAVRAEAARQALRRGWTTGGELLADAPPVLRHLILRRLRRSPGSGDAVIDVVRARYGDREAAVLLPACSAPVVARLLPDLARSLVSWKVLARRHSTAILDWADTALAATGTPDWAPVAAAVRACVSRSPERVLDLLERHVRESLPNVGLAPIAARFPARVVALVTSRITPQDSLGHLLTAQQHLPAEVLRHLFGLGVDALVAVDQICPDFFEMLPADRRVEVYTASRPELPSPGQLALLPEAARVREVRRVLALPRIAADESETRSWSQLLPAAESLPHLDEGARDHRPDQRQEAYVGMVLVARHEPGVLAPMLERLQRMRNEREAVQRPALQALSVLIPHLTDAVAPLLTAITDAAIESRDLSERTRSVLIDLAWAAVAGLPARTGGDALSRWALGMIARLPIHYYLHTPLPPGQERPVTVALLKRITADPVELLELVALLERRARNVPEIQDLLRRAAGPSSPADVRAEAIDGWLDDARTRAERVAELLREDPTAIRLAPVWREVTGWSTILLDGVLPASAAAGPSASVPGSLLVVAGPPARPRRWTARQQRAYATALAAVAVDGDVPQRARVAAVKHLARVPVVGRELLADLLDSPEIPIAEAALSALPWTDRPDQALPILLGYAGGDRARAALPAADRAARFVSPSTLVTLLRGVLFGPPSEVRVSSRKAAVRILARYGPPESPALLAEVWHTPGMHSDVRAAILAALRGPEPSPVAWEIFTEAAGSADPAVASALLSVTPQDLAEPSRSRFAALVVTACTGPDLRIAVEALQNLPKWVPWAPEATGLIADALAHHRNAPGRYWTNQVYDPLVAVLLDHPAEHRLASVFARLVADDQQDLQPGTPDRDRPARREVTRVLASAVRWAHAHRTASPTAASSAAASLAAARAAARVLAAHPVFLADGAELLLALANSRLAPLAEVADLVAERPALAVRLAEKIEEPRPPADLPETAGVLGDRGDLAGGLFAVALVAAAGGAGGARRWKEPWPEALNRLRTHPNPDVADAAYRRMMSR